MWTNWTEKSIQGHQDSIKPQLWQNLGEVGKRKCKESNQWVYSNEKSLQPQEYSAGFSDPLSAKDFLWKLEDAECEYTKRKATETEMKGSTPEMEARVIKGLIKRKDACLKSLIFETVKSVVTFHPTFN